ncbi:hypothetical protein E4U16_000806, partial [Claviceps sp. LM84 group G4]
MSSGSWEVTEATHGNFFFPEKGVQNFAKFEVGYEEHEVGYDLVPDFKRQPNDV